MGNEAKIDKEAEHRRLAAIWINAVQEDRVTAEWNGEFDANMVDERSWEFVFDVALLIGGEQQAAVHFWKCCGYTDRAGINIDGSSGYDPAGTWQMAESWGDVGGLGSFEAHQDASGCWWAMHSCMDKYRDTYIPALDSNDAHEIADIMTKLIRCDYDDVWVKPAEVKERDYVWRG